jgi:hypothetical protein
MLEFISTTRMRTAASAKTKTTQNKIMKLNYKKISETLAAMTFTFIGFAVSLQATTLSDQGIGGYSA